MSLDFITTEEAKQAEGLTMTVVTAVPSPWGEAAKAILTLKGITFGAVPFDGMDQDQAAWTGSNNAPCLMKKGEPARSNWLDILLYAEQVAPSPALIPSDPMDRAFMIGMAHELMGQQSLTWARRVQLIHMGSEGTGGFPAPVAQFLGAKYGANELSLEEASKRVHTLLTLFDDRLTSQKSIGSDYLIGHSLTALDIYLAVAMGIIVPLSADECKMHPKMRAAFETPAPSIDASLTKALIEHRDRIYQHHIGLPVELAPTTH